MQAEGEMRGGAFEWIAFGFSGGLALLSEAEPHGFDVGASSVFGGGGIAEGDGFDEVLALAGRPAPRVVPVSFPDVPDQSTQRKNGSVAYS